MQKEQITVQGNGKIDTHPDAVVLNLRVETKHADPTGALGLCGAAASALLQQLHACGLADADLKTASTRIDTYWDPQLGRPEGYQAQQSIHARVTEVSAASKILTAAAAAAGAAFRMDGISWTVLDAAPLHLQARELAVKDAYQKANQLAQLCGRQLGPVIQITEQGATAPLIGGSPKLAMASEMMDLPLEGGSESISYQVEISWQLN